MLNPYRTPSLPEKKKENKILKMISKITDLFVWLFTKTPFGFILAMLALFGVLFTSIFYFSDHANAAMARHANHDAYVVNQEICQAANAWYVHSEDYHGLISCHRLDNHEQFYVVPATGLMLFRVPRVCGETFTIRIER